MGWLGCRLVALHGCVWWCCRQETRREEKRPRLSFEDRGGWAREADREDDGGRGDPTNRCMADREEDTEGREACHHSGGSHLHPHPAPLPSGRFLSSVACRYGSRALLLRVGVPPGYFMMPVHVSRGQAGAGLNHEAPKTCMEGRMTCLSIFEYSCT